MSSISCDATQQAPNTLGQNDSDTDGLAAMRELPEAYRETLTMRLEPAGEGALAVVTEWETTRVRVTIRRSQ